MGTPDFARVALESMLEDEHFEIAAVVTQPDRPAGRKMQLTPSPVKMLALSRGLTVFDPKTVNTQEFRDQIAALGVESAVVVAFGQLLGDAFLELFPHKAVNVHGSLLPRWRGAAPIQRALMAGDRASGVALQIVVKKLDAGPVLGVRKIDQRDEMTAADVYPRLAQLGCELLRVEYMDYLRGNLTPVEQDEALVTVAPKIAKSEAAIDWSRSAREIMNLVRGLALGPVPHARRAAGWAPIDRGEPNRNPGGFKIHRCVVVEESSVGGIGSDGKVLRISDEGCDIQCGKGVLRLLEVQPDSRAKMAFKDYLRGYPLALGEVLQNGLVK